MSNVWNSGSKDGSNNQHPPIWLNEQHSSYLPDNSTSNRYPDVSSNNFQQHSQTFPFNNQYAKSSYPQNYGSASTISDYSDESNAILNRKSVNVPHPNFLTQTSKDSFSALNSVDLNTSMVLQAVSTLSSLGALDLDPNLMSALSQQTDSNKLDNYRRQPEIYSPTFNSPSPSPETKSSDITSKKINRARPFYEQYNAYETEDNETSKVDPFLNRTASDRNSTDFYSLPPNQQDHRSQSPFSHCRSHYDSTVDSVGTRSRVRNKYSPFTDRSDRSNSRNRRNRSISDDRRAKSRNRKSRSRSCDNSKKRAVLALLAMTKFENKQFVQAQQPSSVLLVVNLENWITDKTLWGAIHSKSDKFEFTPPFYIETAIFHLSETDKESKLALIAFPTVAAAETCMEKSECELSVVGRKTKSFKMMYYIQNSLIFETLQHRFTRLWKAVMNRKILESKESRTSKGKSQNRESENSHRNIRSEEKDLKVHTSSDKNNTERTENDDNKFEETTNQTVKDEPEENEIQGQVISDKNSKEFSKLKEINKEKPLPNIIKTNVIIGKMKSYVIKQFKSKPTSEDESTAVKNISGSSDKPIGKNKDNLDDSSKTFRMKDTRTDENISNSLNITKEIDSSVVIKLEKNTRTIENPNACQIKVEKPEEETSDDETSNPDNRERIQSDKNSQPKFTHSTTETGKTIVPLDKIDSSEIDTKLANIEDGSKKEDELAHLRIKDIESTSSKTESTKTITVDETAKVENMKREKKEPEHLCMKESSDETSEIKTTERKTSPGHDDQSSKQKQRESNTLKRSRSRDKYRGKSRSRDKYRGRSRSRDKYRGRSHSRDKYRGRSHSRDRYKRSRSRDRIHIRDLNNPRRDDFGRKRRHFGRDDAPGGTFNERDETCNSLGERDFSSYRDRKRNNYIPPNYSQNKRHNDPDTAYSMHRTSADNDDIDGNEDDYWSKKRESTKISSAPINPWITNQQTPTESASISTKDLKNPEFLLRVLLQTSIMIQNSNLTMVNPMDSLSLADKELVLQTLNELDQMPIKVIKTTVNDMNKFNAAENRVLNEAISNISMFKAALTPPASSNTKEENMEIDSDDSREESLENIKQASVYVSMTNIKPSMHTKEDVTKFLFDMNLKFDTIKIHTTEKNEFYTNGFIKFNNFENASEFLKRTNKFLYLGNDKEGIKLDITDVLDKRKKWLCTFCSLKNLCATHVCSKCGKIKEKLLDVQVSREPTNKLILINFLKISTVKNIKNVLAKIAPRIALLKVNLHTDSSNENIYNFIVVVENREMGSLLRKSVMENLVEFSSLRAGSKIAVKYLVPDPLPITAPSASHTTGKRVYSLVDVPRLAQYSASLYAKNEAEIFHYYQHYTNLYTQELIKGNIINVVLPEDDFSQAQVLQKPNGTDGKYWPPPNESTFTYDNNSGYYFDHSTQLFYERSSKYFYNMDIGKFLQYDPSRCTYVLVQNSEISSAPVKTTQNEPNDNYIASSTVLSRTSHSAEPPKTENSAPQKTEDSDELKINPPTKESRIHAKKVMQDMKKWAKAVKKNDRKKSLPTSTITSENEQMSIPADVGFNLIRKTSTPADVCFDIIRTIKSEAVKPVSSSSPSISSTMLENPGLCEEEKEEQMFIDLENCTCNLCHRVFSNVDILLKHSKFSDLHKNNIKKWYVSKNLDPDNEENRKRQYRIRALGLERGSLTSPKRQEAGSNSPESLLCLTPMCMSSIHAGLDTCLNCFYSDGNLGVTKTHQIKKRKQDTRRRMRKEIGFDQRKLKRSNPNMKNDYLGLGAHEASGAEPMEGEKYVNFIRRMQQKRFEEASQRTSE